MMNNVLLSTLQIQVVYCIILLLCMLLSSLSAKKNFQIAELPSCPLILFQLARL